MTATTTTTTTTAAGPHWICPAYGAPDASSECSRVAGYYSVAALIVFSTAYAAAQSRAA